MAIEKDALYTAQAMPDRVRFHWGKGLEVISEREVSPFVGCPVMVKNGSPESPITRDVITRVCKKGPESWFYVDRRMPNGRGQTIVEQIKVSGKRIGLGRYESDDNRHVVYIASTVGPGGLNAYLATVDAYESKKKGEQS